ncbi:MAG: iron-sulfur cluster assembly protein [Rickettsiales bacterium]|jgi:FeS assembly SUF system protein|nr:iron-sulfur cluster assembly protein [Rickettsiales bacterium]
MTELDIINAVKTVYDPEIPVNLYDLGLIYKIALKGGKVQIDMTLTSPACPMADDLPKWVEDAVMKVPGVAEVHVKLVWEPAWNLDMMSDEARFQLDLTKEGW